MAVTLTQQEIDARLERYARSWHARDLWPDVTAAQFRAAQVAQAEAARLVLAGERTTLELPPGVSPRAAGVAASASGMGPLLGFWCESGQLRAEPVLAALLSVHLEHGRRRAALLSSRLRDIAAACAARGVVTVLLKGMETARSYFPEPGARPCADIDLLVAAGDLPEASEALRSLGFSGPHLALPQRATWYPSPERRVVSLELAHEHNPWAVDLHTALDRAQLRGVRTPAIVPDVAACTPADEFGERVRVLPPPLKLLYLALHASHHFSTITLVRLVELVLVARAEFVGRPDHWRELHDLLRHYRAARFTYPALSLAERLAPGTMDAGVLAAAGRDAAPWLRRAVRRLTPGTAQELHPLRGFEALRWARTPLEVAAGAADLVWPRGMHPAEVLRLYASRARRVAGAAAERLRS